MGVIKTFSEFINESIWSDMQDRSAGDTVRQEDLIVTNEELKNRIQKLYKEQGEGETLDVSSLTNRIKCDDFSYIFNELAEVKYIIGLENWDVSNVENILDMFRDCIKFNCDLSKWNVSSVKNMVGMFMGCINFNYDLSKWDVSSVETIIIDMFDGCKSLKQIPSWYINR